MKNSLAIAPSSAYLASGSRVAAYAAAWCGLHCALTPVLVLVTPALALSESFERAVWVGTALLGAAMLAAGPAPPTRGRGPLLCRRHRALGSLPRRLAGAHFRDRDVDGRQPHPRWRLGAEWPVSAKPGRARCATTRSRRVEEADDDRPPTIRHTRRRATCRAARHPSAQGDPPRVREHRTPPHGAGSPRARPTDRALPRACHRLSGLEEPRSRGVVVGGGASGRGASIRVGRTPAPPPLPLSLVRSGLRSPSLSGGA